MKAETIFRAYKRARLSLFFLAPRAFLPGSGQEQAWAAYEKRGRQADKFEAWLMRFFYRMEG